MQAIDILKKYWGYTSFKSKQEEIINSVVDKKDTLALLPTAGGKSICFQIPALLCDGLCIVVSPLISLMQDQTKFLKSKGVNTIAISSIMSSNEIDTALTNCIYGNIKFLYISPERLRSKNVIEKIMKMNINLIAVDEAHCISDWGHNFRPSYRLINELRKIKKETPVIALTATANKQVIEDIQANLNFKESNVIKSSFYRKNLSYVAIECKNKSQTLINLCKKIKSSIIIYVGSRKESNSISQLLNKNTISAVAYHAGIEIEKRKVIQQQWIENSTRVIVATNAFGMGVNKLDVRLVVHLNIPVNIESYFQESGRAGRDNKTAYSFILYNNNDLNNSLKLINDRFPLKIDLQNTYQKICDDLQVAVNTLPEDDFNFNIKDFCKKYKLDIIKTYNVIRYLEKEELIKLNNLNKKSARIKILLSSSELYKFQIANSYFDNIIKLLLRKFPNIFKNHVNINEEELQKNTKTDKQSIKEILVKLDQKGVISYLEKTSETSIKFIQNRKDAKYLEFSESNIEKEREHAKEKLEKIIDYIKNKNRCRNKILLEYFSEEKLENCKICDNCIKLNKEKIKEELFDLISKKIVALLENKEFTFNEIKHEIEEEDEEILKNVLNYLFDNDLINKFGNKYTLNTNK